MADPQFVNVQMKNQMEDIASHEADPAHAMVILKDAAGSLGSYARHLRDEANQVPDDVGRIKAKFFQQFQKSTTATIEAL